MSIFGQLDAANVRTNPFFVEAGDYTAEVTEAKYKENKDGQRQLYIQYTITNEDSQYLDSKVSHYFDLVDSEMTQEKFLLLPAEEQKKTRMSMANLKKTLCGADGNDKFRGLGVDPDALNYAGWDPTSLIGTKVMVGITNWGTDGVNIRWVNLQD